MVARLGLGLSVIPASSRPAPTSAPVNVVAPSITGILTQGQTLTADPGEWSQLPSPAFTYQWKRSGGNISGATASTYVPDADDVAAGAGAITVTVTATNDLGSTNATSAGVTIAATLALSGTPGSATVGVAYSFTPTTTGGHAAYTYALTGTLPAGLSFSTSTGAITGTPTTSETASGLDITVTDADGLTASLGTFSITVSAGSVADIDSLEIVSGAVLLDQTNDYGDATSRVGINGNGWVGKAVLPFLVGQTFDPTKITLEVTDPGYDASGSTTVSRTITGGVILRRQYNAASSKQQSDNGVTLTVYFSLDQLVYDGTTIVSAEAATGFYGGADAGEISSVTNSSTLAYEKPSAAFLNLPYERATGSTFAVELIAYHHAMRSGRQVARVEFIAKDSQGTPNVAATQTASSASLSAIQTKGQIVEAYKASIPLTNLTQGDVCYVNAKVYPWIGDSTAVLDLEVDGVNTTGTLISAQPVTPLRFKNDKDGTYGGAHAAVQAGAVGGTVQSSYAAAVADPFPTLNAAIAALPAWNTANKTGNTTHSGSTIWLMDDGVGGNVDHALTAGTSGTAAGDCWTDIKVDTAATGQVRLSIASTFTTAQLLRHFEDIVHSGGSGLDGGNSNASRFVAFEGSTITMSGTSQTAPINYRFGMSYFRNVTFSGMSINANTPFKGFSTTRTQAVMALGCVSTDTTSDRTNCFIWVCVGNHFARIILGDHSVANDDPQDGMIIANNKFMNLQSQMLIGGIQNFTTYGVTIVQNLFERAVAATSVPALSVSEGLLGMKLLWAYNGVPGIDDGSRANFLYTDDAGAQNLTKLGFFKYCGFDTLNNKSDTFVTNTTETGRVGNWRLRHGVEMVGVVSAAGSGNGLAPSNDGTDNWLGHYWPPGNEPNAGRADITFTNNQSGTTGAGNGDYTLTGATNDLHDRVPSGMAGLGYDLAGVARRNDGTGAAWPYERAA